MGNELISIITPFRNSSKYLDECLNSIINQSYKDWELIIVDDYSTDKSFEIVKEFANIGYKKVKSKSRNKSIPSFEHQKISNDLKKMTGKDIKLKVLKSGKGKLEISFNNNDELSEIIKYFGI